MNKYQQEIILYLKNNNKENIWIKHLMQLKMFKINKKHLNLNHKLQDLIQIII